MVKETTKTKSTKILETADFKLTITEKIKYSKIYNSQDKSKLNFINFLWKKISPYAGLINLIFNILKRLNL